MEQHFDAIVVGGGSAGSVVTRRLHDAGKRVALIEAGGYDTDPAIHEPNRMHELWHGPNDWDYFSTPQAHAEGRSLHLPRGKVLGGSHALNGMIYVRCTPYDFDHWASLGSDVGIGACRDAARAVGAGAFATWPTRMPSLLGAPIDHVLATGSWTPLGFRVIETHDDAGSDHRPIVAVLRAADD